MFTPLGFWPVALAAVSSPLAVFQRAVCVICAGTVSAAGRTPAVPLCDSVRATMSGVCPVAVDSAVSEPGAQDMRWSCDSGAALDMPASPAGCWREAPVSQGWSGAAPSLQSGLRQRHSRVSETGQITRLMSQPSGNSYIRVQQRAGKATLGNSRFCWPGALVLTGIDVNRPWKFVVTLALHLCFYQCVNECVTYS